MKLVVICLSILLLYNISITSSVAFVLFKKNFCKAFDVETYNRTLDYTATVFVPLTRKRARVPLDVHCVLESERSLCVAYIKPGVIKSMGLHIHDNTERPLSFSEYRYSQLKQRLQGPFVGHVNFKRSFLDNDDDNNDEYFIYVDFIITNYRGQQWLSGIGSALMATMFDIAQQCKYPSVKLFSLTSAKPFYRKLGMELFSGNHEFRGNLTLVRDLKRRTNLKLVKVT